MSTRSRIGILHADGSTDTIYCHSDGYPEHQMPILREHYNTTEKVRELLSLGDLSLLAERIAPEPDEEHGFAPADRAENVTVAYHRDACLRLGHRLVLSVRSEQRKLAESD